MPATLQPRVTAAATASSQPYSTEERDRHPLPDWLKRNRRILERRYIGQGVRGAHAKGSTRTSGATSTIPPPTHGGSTRIRMPLLTSHTGGLGYTIDESTMRGQSMHLSSPEADSEGSDEDIMRGQLKEKQGDEITRKTERESVKYQRSRNSASPEPPPLVLVAKWSPIRFGRRLSGPEVHGAPRRHDAVKKASSALTSSQSTYAFSQSCLNPWSTKHQCRFRRLPDSQRKL